MTVSFVEMLSSTIEISNWIKSSWGGDGFRSKDGFLSMVFFDTRSIEVKKITFRYQRTKLDLKEGWRTTHQSSLGTYLVVVQNQMNHQSWQKGEIQRREFNEVWDMEFDGSIAVSSAGGVLQNFRNINNSCKDTTWLCDGQRFEK